MSDNMLLSRAKFQNFYSSCAQSVSWGKSRGDAIERVALLPLAVGVAELLKALYPAGHSPCLFIGGLFPIWKTIKKAFQEAR